MRVLIRNTLVNSDNCSEYRLTRHIQPPIIIGNLCEGSHGNSPTDVNGNIEEQKREKEGRDGGKNFSNANSILPQLRIGIRGK